MSLNIDLHKNILTMILKDIFTNLSLAPLLGFKGGTAALFFYGLTRFSVDLDFDLLQEDKTDFIFTEIEKILKNYGNIKESSDKRYSLLFILSYNEKSENSQNIKVEINKRNFGSKYELKQYLGIPILVMIKKDIVANKLVAMHERIGKANRDIYDVYFFLKNNWIINKKIVEQRTGMEYKFFLQTCINDLNRMSDKNILSGIGELLDEKQRIWVKNNLKKETIFLLSLYLKNEINL